MNSQLSVLLVMCAIAAVSNGLSDASPKEIHATNALGMELADIIKPSKLSDRKFNLKKINQRANIAKFNLLVKRFTKLASSSSARPARKGNQKFVLLNASIREIIEKYGLNFLIQQLKGATVQIYENYGPRQDTCFISVTCKWKLICRRNRLTRKSECVWKLFKIKVVCCK